MLIMTHVQHDLHLLLRHQLIRRRPLIQSHTWI
jgi:hypothetical protein